jgi:hypothetical protein
MGSKMNPVSVILLSDFCSGSTALQSEITKSPVIKRSRAVETQYWCRAAALLGMQQHDIMSSILPMPTDVAKKALVDFLSDNLPHYSPPNDDKILIFDGWRRLCANHSPYFFEKSPHHLHYWSALQLIYQAVQDLDDVEFKFIGLIRNPLDTIFSRWRQWRNNPYKAQWLWFTAYSNLLSFKELVGDRILICRYEALVANQQELRTVFQFLGTEPPPLWKSALHPRSIRRWNADPYFGFHLDATIKNFAESLGYKPEELHGRKRFIWPIYWRFAKLKFGIGEIKRRMRAASRFGGSPSSLVS